MLSSIISKGAWISTDIMPGLRWVSDEERIVCNGPKQVIGVVFVSKIVVLSPISSEFFMFADQEVSIIEMLMCGKAVTALEEEVGRVFFP